MSSYLHWIAAVAAVIVVVLEGDRTGWLIIRGAQRTAGAWLTRLARVVTMGAIAAGLFVRAVGSQPFEWFHGLLLLGLACYGAGLLLLRRDGGQDPT